MINCDQRWSLADGKINCFEWEIPFEFYAERTKSLSDKMLCGTPLSRRKGVSVEQLLLEEDYEDLANPFAVLNKQENGVEIITDPFSYQPLYWYRSDKIHICGTRADYVAKAAEMFDDYPMQLHTDCILNMLALGQAQGLKTAFKRVKMVPLGHRVRTKALEFVSERFWKDYTEAIEISPSETEDILNRFIDQQSVVIKNMVKASNHPPEIDLTGGKDSRAVLALCKKAGVLKDVRFATMGGESGPDVIIASHLADELDLDFTHRSWLPPLRPWEAETRYRTLECFGRKRGQELVDPLPERIWRSNGFLGETLRMHFSGINPDISRERVMKRHDRFFGSRNELVKAEIVDRYVQESQSRFERLLDTGTAPNMVFDRSHVKQTLHTHYAMRPRHFDRNLIALYFPELTQLSFSLPFGKRLNGWIVEEIYRKSGLETQIPLTKKLTDDPDLKLKRVERFSKAKTKQLNSEFLFFKNVKSNPEWKPQSPNRYRFLKDSLLQNRHRKIFDYVDFDGVEKALAKPFNMNLRLSRKLSDIHSASLWLDDFKETANLRTDDLSGE